MSCSDSEPSPLGVGGSPGIGGRAASAGNGNGAGAGGSSPIDDEPDFSVPLGYIRVRTWFEFGETELAASFADGPTPRLHVESDRRGSCRLMTFRASTCTPACEGGAICVAERCETFPALVNRGSLTWSWPGGQQTVSAAATGNYYASGSASTPGDVAVVVDGTSLSAPTDETLAPVGDWGQLLADRAGADVVTLSWSNPRPAARVRLHMTDCDGSHGAQAAAEIECDAADTGSLVLPSPFLDELDAGSWGRGECGSHRFERYFSDGDDTLRLESIAPAGLFYRP